MKLPIIDSFICNIENKGNFQYSIIKNINETKDSCILIFDINSKLLYSFNPDSQLLKSLTIDNKILKKAKRIFIQNSTCFTLENDNKTLTQFNLISKKKREHKLTIKSQIDFYNLYSPFEIKKNSTFLYKIPNYNIQNKTQRESYFKSNLISCISFNENAFIDSSIQIKFPKKYIENFFYDYYPIVSNRNDSNFAYSFKHLDTIYYCHNNVKKIIIIPKEYSTQSSLFPEDLIASYSFSNEYETKSAMNYKILISKNKIILFQKSTQDLLNGKEELNSFESSPKKILIFNIINGSIFNAYKLPNYLETRSSFLFNDKIITPNLDNAQKLILYATKI
jgi:hypothetical protein